MLSGGCITFSGGSALGGASISPITTPSYAPAPAPQSITVQNLTLAVGSGSLGNLVDGRAASVISQSGRLVAVAANNGMQASAARRQNQASILQPSFITA
jgi:hypothetical protein